MHVILVDAKIANGMKNAKFAETVHAVMDIHRKRLNAKCTKKVGEYDEDVVSI